MFLSPYYRLNNDFMDPFREMERMERAMFGRPNRAERSGFIRTDIKESDGAYVLMADLPGFKKEDIDIEIGDGVLTLTAKQNEETEEKDEDGRFLMHERRSGVFKRSYDTTGIDTEKLTATFENGVLKLTMPKLELKAPETRHLMID